ncbi:MAG: guanylate kinase [Clostridia bacterium]|nr:guanylate kinase [Clostridia bacterium]
MTDKGILFVFSGPSGTGKGTILSSFNQKYDDKNIKYSVSATTRAPRPTEIDGINYFFKTEDEFNQMIKNDEFFEWAEFCGNLYGTPKKAVFDLLESGKDVILEIETKGALNVKRMYPDAVSIFILPPSLSELKSRLMGRGTETPESVQNRFETASRELPLAENYDYIIINDVLDDAVEKFRYIIESQRLKTNNNKNTILEVLKK